MVGAKFVKVGMVVMVIVLVAWLCGVMIMVLVVWVGVVTVMALLDSVGGVITMLVVMLLFKPENINFYAVCCSLITWICKHTKLQGR